MWSRIEKSKDFSRYDLYKTTGSFDYEFTIYSKDVKQLAVWIRNINRYVAVYRKLPNKYQHISIWLCPKN